MNNNKYGSLINTFYASDLYNLVMPAVPPADLSIAQSLFATSYLGFRNSSISKVVDFNINDNPYIRGIGLTSNLADGLVDAAIGHYGTSDCWQLRLTPHRVSADLTGTISNVVGTAVINGIGTLFTRELAKGATISWVDDNLVVRYGIILSITDNYTLTLTANTDTGGMFAGATTSSEFNVLTGVWGYLGNTVSIPILIMNSLNPFAFFGADVSLLTDLTGAISMASGSATVTGVGTLFQTELATNQIFGWTDDLGIRRTGVVSAIASDTSMTLTAVSYSAATNRPMLTLDNSIRLRFDMVGDFNAYTIAIDPAFATKRLSISAFAEIEHSFAMSDEL